MNNAIETEGKTKFDIHKELDRVALALEDAEKRLSDLKIIKIYTSEQKTKMGELTMAIKIGKLYRDKIKARC